MRIEESHLTTCHVEPEDHIRYMIASTGGQRGEGYSHRAACSRSEFSPNAVIGFAESGAAFLGHAADCDRLPLTLAIWTFWVSVWVPTTACKFTTSGLKVKSDPAALS
jgi:hypothetical protein